MARQQYKFGKWKVHCCPRRPSRGLNNFTNHWFLTIFGWFLDDFWMMFDVFDDFWMILDVFDDFWMILDVFLMIFEWCLDDVWWFLDVSQEHQGPDDSSQRHKHLSFLPGRQGSPITRLATAARDSTQAPGWRWLGVKLSRFNCRPKDIGAVYVSITHRIHGAACIWQHLPSIYPKC